MEREGDECSCDGPYDLRGRHLKHVLRRLLEDSDDDQGPVVKICLADNEIGWLPKRFCTRHTGVTHLCLHGNGIVALPDELRLLTQLQRLCLRGNKIVQLPAQLERLVNLHTLILDGNPIKALPEGICSLRRLEVLSIDCPSLETLPSQFGRMRSLKRLNLGSAPIVQFPYSVRYLSNLETLDIAEDSVLWKHVNPTEFSAMSVQNKLRYLSDRSLKDSGFGAGRSGQFFRRVGGIHGLRAILKFQEGKPLAKDMKNRGIDYKQALLCGHHELVDMHLKAKQQPATELALKLVPMLGIVQDLAARGFHATNLWILQHVQPQELQHNVWRTLVEQGRLPPGAMPPDVPTLQNVSPATFAAATGNLQVLRELPNVTSRSNLSGNATPRFGLPGVLGALGMVAQSNSNAADRRWLKACLEAAVKYRRAEVIELFLAEVFKQEDGLQQPFTDALCQALDAGHEAIALRMIGAGVNCLNVSSQHSEPPIMYACRSGLVTAARAILARYPTPVAAHLEPSCQAGRTSDSDWYAPAASKSLIAVAAAHGHADVVEILAQHGLSVNASSEYRMYSRRVNAQDSPLMAAAKNGHVEALNVLLRYGADPNAQSVQGLTPLMYAIERRSAPMVAALLRHGAFSSAAPASNTPPPTVNTPLRLPGGHVVFNATDTINMESPLQVAVRVGSVEIVRMLLAAGADPNLDRTPGGNAPLIMAAAIRDNAVAMEIIAELLSRGANIDCRAQFGSTALTEACCRPGALDVVKQLVAAGATCHPQALASAARAHAYDTLIWLIYNSADPSLVQPAQIRDADAISTNIVTAASKHVAAVGYENI